MKAPSYLLIGVTSILCLIGGPSFKDDASSAIANPCTATYNPTTNTLHVPCLDLGGPSFWVDLELLQICFLSYGENTINATVQDFIGTWGGQVVSAEGTDELILNLASSDGINLTGSLTDVASAGTTDILGSVSNGILGFNPPPFSSDLNNPDCVRWDVSCTGTLQQGLASMLVQCSGTFCGAGGGKYMNLTGILNKE